MKRQQTSPLGAVAAVAAALASPVTLYGADPSTPVTPIQHVAVIFDENNAFDHYFATYPNASNPPGEPQFTPLPNTPPSTD
jgi:phospholipase C